MHFCFVKPIQPTPAAEGSGSSPESAPSLHRYYISKGLINKYK